MSLIKKLCLVGVALLLLLAGVFAWHKGLPPFEGWLNPAVEQAEAGKADSASKSGQDAAQGESPLQNSDHVSDNGTDNKTPENAPEQAVEQVAAEASGDKPAEGEVAASPATDEEGAAPGEAVVPDALRLRRLRG